MAIVHVLNRIASHTLKGIIIIQAWTGNKANVNHIHVFGSLICTYFHYNFACIFICYCEISKGHHL
jgi:hypothetical protein